MRAFEPRTIRYRTLALLFWPLTARLRPPVIVVGDGLHRPELAPKKQVRDPSAEHRHDQAVVIAPWTRRARGDQSARRR
ncbi:MAG: hypothetical protein JO363_06010 [Solirubrobacterales bacterium]|nr:hypothetical protein [Solirubrobacterales bacterium]